MSHTPGPWEVQRAFGDVTIHALGGSIADVHRGGEEQASNARLIVSAPALAAENARLREALTEIAKGEGPYSRDPLEHASNTIDAMKARARAALAQAERGQ